MEIITKFFGTTKEVDLEETVRLSIEVSNVPFAINDLVDAIIAANPQDDFMQDVEFVRRQVSRYISGVYSNRMCPVAAYYICDELPDGRYVRRGVEVLEEQPVLVAMSPTWEGSEKHTVAVLAPTSSPLAKGEMEQRYCQSKAEAEAYIAEKYPHATRVGWQEIFAEYRSRVAKSGISFETRSHLMR